jgi:hypothetical protein
MHSRFGFSVVCIPDLNKDGIDGKQQPFVLLVFDSLK